MSSEIPILGSLSQFGGHDRGYDMLILCGPLLIAVLAVFGRSVVTLLLASGYVAVFVLYTLWNSIERWR